MVGIAQSVERQIVALEVVGSIPTAHPIFTLSMDTYMSTALIWGSILILFGCSLIFKTLFGFSIPIIRPLIGIFLIYNGIMMVFCPHQVFRIPEGTVAFSSRTIHARKAAKSYQTVFGSSTINLSDIELDDIPKKISVSTAFGSTQLIINKRIPTRIKLSCAFSHALMPDGSRHSLGEYSYTTSNRKPELIIDLRLAFTNLEIIEV